MSTTATSTADQVKAFAQALFEPADLVEIRVLPSGTQRWVEASTLHSTAMPDDQNIYVGANPRKCNGGTAADVLLARCFFVDFDGVALDEVRRRIDEESLPQPTVIVNSGHGVHCYWRLEEPITDLALWTARQRALIAKLDSDAVIYDPSRVMRLPGFLNLKSEPPVPCELVESVPERVYPIDEFPEPATASGSIVANSEVEDQDRVRLCMDSMLRMDMADQADGSKRLYACACRAVEHDLDDDQAVKVVRAYGALRQFPRQYKPSDFVKRLRDAERKCKRGVSVNGHVGRLDWCRMSEIEREAIEWLWHRRLVRNKLNLIAGDPGVCKSFLMMYLAAQVSKGRRWFKSEDDNPAGNVILLSAEDGLADTVRGRLDDHGADVERVIVVKAVFEVDGKGRQKFSLQRDLEKLARLISELGDVRLVIIDPLGAYTAGKVKDNSDYQQVGEVMHDLGTFAERCKVAVVAVMHLNKTPTTTTRKALYRVLGSIAYAAGPRSIWIVALDKLDSSKRLLLCAKMNVAIPASGLAFRIEEGQVRWVDEEVNITADEALRDTEPGQEDEASRLDEAVDFLREALANGEQRQTAVEKLATKAGVTKPTLKRAKRKLRVKSKPIRNEKGQIVDWVWELTQRTTAATLYHLDHLDPLDPLGEPHAQGAQEAQEDHLSMPGATGGGDG